MDKQLRERELNIAEQRENTMQQLLNQQQQQNQAEQVTTDTLKLPCPYMYILLTRIKSAVIETIPYCFFVFLHFHFRVVLFRDLYYPY